DDATLELARHLLELPADRGQKLVLGPVLLVVVEGPEIVDRNDPEPDSWPLSPDLRDVPPNPRSHERRSDVLRVVDHDRQLLKVLHRARDSAPFGGQELAARDPAARDPGAPRERALDHF